MNAPETMMPEIKKTSLIELAIAERTTGGMVDGLRDASWLDEIEPPVLV